MIDKKQLQQAKFHKISSEKFYYTFTVCMFFSHCTSSEQLGLVPEPNEYQSWGMDSEMAL